MDQSGPPENTEMLGDGQLAAVVQGKSGKPRIVKISYDAARTVDRYLRARVRHPQAWRARPWLGAGSRGR